MPAPGGDFKFVFYLRDYAGDPVTGATSFTVKYSIGGGALTTESSPTVEELGSGLYAWTVPTAVLSAMKTHEHVTALIQATGAVDVVYRLPTYPLTTGEVDSGSNSASSFVTTLSSAAADFYAGTFVCFTTGNLALQVRKVSSSSGSTLSFDTPFTETPAVGDKFFLVNR